MSGTRMDGAARRTQLLDAARRRFAADGYRATTTSSIASEAGVSEPLVFKHFASKEELFRLSIVEPMLDLLREHTEARSADASVTDQEHALRDFLRTWAALVRDERALAMTLLVELNEFPDVGAQIAASTDRPEYRDFDAAVATWSSLAAATVAGLVADDIDEFVDEHVRILLHGVRAS